MGHLAIRLFASLSLERVSGGAGGLPSTQARGAAPEGPDRRTLLARPGGTVRAPLPPYDALATPAPGPTGCGRPGVSQGNRRSLPASAVRHQTPAWVRRAVWKE